MGKDATVRSVQRRADSPFCPSGAVAGRTNWPGQFSRPIEGHVAISNGMDAPHQRPATPAADCMEERQGTSGAEGLRHVGRQLCGVRWFVERPTAKFWIQAAWDAWPACRSSVLILGILKIKAMRGYRHNVQNNYLDIYSIQILTLKSHFSGTGT